MQTIIGDSSLPTATFIKANKIKMLVKQMFPVLSVVNAHCDV